MSRVVAAAVRVVQRAARVVSTLLVSLDGRPLPPSVGTSRPEDHRP